MLFRSKIVIERERLIYDGNARIALDEQEIGPLFKGQKLDAQRSYVEGIVAVLNNCKRFLADDYDIFLVANDKYNLYPKIAEGANMQIVEQIKRPVLNRTERDKGAYCEIIFHLKQK